MKKNGLYSAARPVKRIKQNDVGGEQWLKFFEITECDESTEPSNGMSTSSSPHIVNSLMFSHLCELQKESASTTGEATEFINLDVLESGKQEVKLNPKKTRW